MSLTNNNRETTGTRPMALRDLRFAGTVAAGLVAGVLGVGALSAPLLGWTEWPDALQPGREEVVRMKPGEIPPIAENRSSRTATPSEETITIPGPGGTTLVVPTSSTGVSAPGTGSGSGGSVQVGVGGEEDGAGSGFGESGFANPDLRDADGDGMPDVWG